MAVYFGTPLAKKLGIQRKLSCGSRSLNDRDQFWRTFCGILPNKNIWSVFNRDNPQMSTPCGTSFPPSGILYFTPEFFYRICGVSLNATGAFIPLDELFVSIGILIFPMLRRDAAGDQLTIPRAEAPHFVPPLRFQRSRANDQDLRYSSFACE